MLTSSNSNNNWGRWHNRLHNLLKLNPDLLPKGKPLLVSLSGGQDSMALIGLLIDLQKLHKWRLLVWHGDHGWHKNSVVFASELKKWCEEKNLCFYSNQGDINEIKTESLARTWRYKELKNTIKLIAKTKELEPCNHVLTGHTSSDRTETLLLNLARGTDLSGLSSIHCSRELEEASITEKIKLVRPMLCFSREETKLICSELKLPIWIDPSNQNINISRNKVRHKVIPILEELYPGCSLRIASLSERISFYQKDQNAIIELAITSLKNHKGLCRKGLIKIPKTARATLISYWLKQKGVPSLSSAQLQEISLAIGPKKKPGKRSLAKGWIIEWNRESVHIEHPKNNN